MNRKLSDEAGFTLVEVLVTIVVQTMIVGALAGAFVVFVRAHDSSKQRFQKSHDAQMAATYFVTDAQAASGPEVSLSDTMSCPDPSPPVSGTLTPVARFTWSVSAAAGTTTTSTINYVKAGTALMRRYCRGGTLIDDTVVGSNIASASVVCTPTTNCTGSPASITITLSETQDASESAPFTYTLTAAFRKVPAGGSAPSPPPTGPFPLLALHTSGTGLQITGSGTLRINNSGTIVVNSNSSNPVQNVGGSITGAASVLGLGTCSNMFCPGNYSRITQAPVDPYKVLAAPSTAGLPARAGCPGGTAQPGVYAAPLSLVDTSCTLASGAYVFQSGLSLVGSGSLTSAAGGVFMYFAGGSLSLTGSGSVNLSPLTTGPYANILVFQSRTSSLPMTLTGSGSVNGYAGLIYAPAAPVSLVGSGSLAVSSLIAGSVGMTVSGGTATIG
jgi:Tfp pilus assembly protein PilV